MLRMFPLASVSLRGSVGHALVMVVGCIPCRVLVTTEEAGCLVRRSAAHTLATVVVVVGCIPYRVVLSIAEAECIPDVSASVRAVIGYIASELAASLPVNVGIADWTFAPAPE